MKTRPSQAPRRRSGRSDSRPDLPLFYAAGLVLAGVAAFSSALDGPFLFDDEWTVLENPHVRALWPLWDSMSAPPQHALGGRPVVAFSFALSYALGGLDPWGYHLWNLAVHVLAALALFGVVRRTCRLPRMSAAIRAWADRLAFAVALIWLVHPLQTEVIGYLTQRTESMAGLFYLLTLYAAIRTMEQPSSSGWTAAAVLACGLGMASKETMATAPVAVLLYDAVFAAGSLSKALRDRAPLYAGLAFTWVLLAWLVADGPRWRSAGFSSGVSPSTYLLHQPAMILTYLKLVVWPSPLVFDYGRTTPIALSVAMPALLVASALLAATIAALWKYPMVGYLGAAFWIALAPSSSIVPIATEVGAERRMYLPLAALITLLILAARWAIRRLVADLPARRAVGAAALGATCVACIWLTALRNIEYRSEVGIWQTVIDRRPNPRAHYNLAGSLVESGRADEAMAHYRAAADGEPQAHYAMAFELEKRGDLAEATGEYEQYLVREPGGTQALAAHIRLGVTRMQLGRLPEAVTSLEAALAMRPDDPDALGAYAHALAESGRIADSVLAFEGLVRVTPDDAEAHQSLGLALLAERRATDAVAPFERAVALDPRDGRKHAMLGSTLLTAGRTAEGLASLNRAFALGYEDPALRAAYAAAGGR